MLVDGGYGEDSVLPNIGMPVLKTLSCWGEERFYQFRFSQFAEETEGVAADVFIGMLKVVSDAIAAGLSVLHVSARVRLCHTRRGSSPASAFRQRPAWDIVRNKSTAASSMACFSRA